MLGLRRLLVLACLSACDSEVELHRELGRDIDVPVDLPPDDGWGHWQGSFTPCDEAAACAVGPSVRGELVVTSAVDIEALSGIRCLYGPLTIAGTDLEDLSGLEALEFVCGDLNITDNPSLVDTSGLGALSAAPRIKVLGNPSLVKLDLPALGYVEHTIRIEQNATLTNLELGALRKVWLLDVIDNGSLTALLLPALEEASRIAVEGAAALTTLDVPALEQLETLSLVDNDSLTQISTFPSLAGPRWIVVRDNGALVSLAGLEAFASADGIVILNNVALDQAYAEAVGAALGGSTKIAGNAGWVVPATCPFRGDGQCDAIGCEGSAVCAEGSDEIDCCECLGLDCP
ncbi:MAG: hypothetical protein HOV80_29410 [Polyangiaceae bacterium]|nr:hypothetical protein [Polyangiaceae bacterium]